VKRFIGIAIGLGVAVIVVALIFKGEDAGFLPALEHRLLDLHFQIRRTAPTSGQVVVIAVDAQSIEEVGRWPWPREIMGELLRRLCEAGISVAAFDIVFSEPQREPAHAFTRRLSETPGLSGEARSAVEAVLSQPTGDEAFAAQIRACRDRVVLGYFLRQEKEWKAPEEDWLEPDALEHFLDYAAIPVATVRSKEFLGVKAKGVEANIPIISDAARHYGFFSLKTDPDGQVRHHQLVWALEGRPDFHPSLALKAVQIYWGGEPPIRLNVDGGGGVLLQAAGRKVYSELRGWQLIDFRGPPETLRYVSAMDVLRGEEDLDLEGKIAFIGVTEVGIKDVRPTSLDPLFPGTEILATVADGMIRGEYLQRTSNDKLLDAALVLLLGLLLGWLLQRIPHAQHALILTLTVTVAYLLWNHAAFVWLHRWMYGVAPLITIAGTYTGVTLYRALAVERRAREIKDVFQKYVAASVVDEMLSNPSHVRLGGEKRVLSILFSDIRDFTSISEGMDPQTLVQFLNAYFTPMTEIIIDSRGTVDKYMGDAIMAFWGAPLKMEDHAVRSCEAALEMRVQLEVLRRSIKDIDIPHLEIGIGINTGAVSVGNMGSEQIYDYTVIGDTANLASRLEGANKTYGTNILITESTWEAFGREGFVVRRIDRVRVKGKAQPVLIMELMGRDGDEIEGGDGFPARFEEGLEAYYDRRFVEALEIFQATLKARPEDKPSRLYIGRCEAFCAYPPPDDWDGVFVMETK